ncbi:hypothetical protein AX774_g4687 [Zancudomyces culisetae]|uniref:Uncharacterized protein n=1 Tax=Zancudomyces culisetae TaxID=1213189 RepID=A0A1R1PLJ6_ZANCU|nr:hypothetical protein AX774_g6577 [Zancudomyces culisetae]OMH81848.1 hypothetical protein AX774_g4687 [Zancudomyces culisetae]|eukprot:OMH79996.1 hypothetical protein AX774_g6577 [Zancudomyces culisetae]
MIIYIYTKEKKQENSKSDKSKEKEKDRQKRKYVTKKSRLSKDDEDDYGTTGDNSSQRSIKNTPKNTLKYATKKSSYDKTAESKKWAHGDKEQKRGMREQHRVDGEDSDQDVSILTTASSSSSSSDYISDSSTENDTYSRANLPERLVLSDAAAYSSVSGPFALMTARLVNHPGYLAKVFGSSFSNSKADGHDDACADIASDYTEFIQSKHKSKNTTTLFEKCGSFGAEYGMTR